MLLFLDIFLTNWFLKLNHLNSKKIKLTQIKGRKTQKLNVKKLGIIELKTERISSKSGDSGDLP